MTISNISISLFGSVADNDISLAPGFNRLHFVPSRNGGQTPVSRPSTQKCNGGQTRVAGDVVAFVIAAFCGFRGDPGAENSAVIPEREKYYPDKAHSTADADSAGDHDDSRYFGGELSFTESGREYIISAKWGATFTEDRVSVIKVGGTSEQLPAGVSVCEKLFRISPDRAARLILLPEDRRDAELMFDSLAESLGSSSLNGGAAGDALEALNRFLQQNNACRKTLLDRRTDLESELKNIDRLERKLGEAANEYISANAAREELAKKVNEDLDVTQISESVLLTEKYAQARELRDDADAVKEEIEAEKKAIRRRKIPLLILLWLLAAVDVFALVLLILNPSGFPVAGPLIEKLGSARLPAMAVCAVLFVALLLGIAAASTSGAGELLRLESELNFKRRRLSELMYPEGNGPDISRYNPADPDEFFDIVDNDLRELAVRAGEAERSLEATRDAHGGSSDSADFSAGNVGNGGQTPVATTSAQNCNPPCNGGQCNGGQTPISTPVARLAALTEARARWSERKKTYSEELAHQRPYAEVKEELFAVGDEIALAERRTEAIRLAEEIINRKSRILDSGFSGRVESLACASMSLLTGGKRTRVGFTSELQPYVDNGDSGRQWPEDLDPQTSGQLMMAVKMAAMTIAVQKKAPADNLFSGSELPPFAGLLILDDPFAAFDASSRILAEKTLSDFAASGVQIIYTDSDSAE